MQNRQADKPYEDIMNLIFTVNGPPVGKERPRVGQTGTVTPDKTKAYERHVRSCCQATLMKPEYRKYRRTVPSSDWQIVDFTVRHKSSKYPDADNIVKVVLDALEGVIWENDKTAIPRVNCVFTHCENPGVVIEIHKALQCECGRSSGRG